VRERDLAETLASSFVTKLYQAVAVARLHDLSNAALEGPIGELKASIDAAIGAFHVASLKPEAEADMLFFNERAVRSKKGSSSSVDGLMKFMVAMGTGELRFLHTLTHLEVRAFLEVVKGLGGSDPDECCAGFAAGLHAAGLKGLVEVFTMAQAAAKAVERKVKVDEATAVRLAYARTLALLREYMKHLHDQELRRYFWRKLLRAVQGIQSLASRARRELLALTLVKTADDYAFNHPVNTCILSIMLGAKAGLPKNQLANVGLAALLHGVGRFRTENLEDPAEYALHPYRAVSTVFEARRTDDTALLTALVAFQFEMGKGVPPVREEVEEIHPLARIVSICEAFDSLTSPRPGTTAVLPDAALSKLLRGKPRGFDITLLGLFANMMGLFPPGSAVLLDTDEIAVVIHPNPDDPRRPVVAIVCDAKGNAVDGDVVDLALRSQTGRFVRSIVKAVDLVKLGIEVPEYLRG
jgi:hypothetical protein